MIFNVKFRNEKGEYKALELSAPTKLDAFIKFMVEHPKWDIASVKRAKPKKVTVQKKKNFQKTLVFTASPREYIGENV